MLGHSSLQMIYQRYFKWISRKTRNDGQAFRSFVEGKANTDKTDVVDLLAQEKTHGHGAKKSDLYEYCTTG